jgi:hypothetical protein
MIPSSSAKRYMYDWLTENQRVAFDEEGASVKKTRPEDQTVYEPMDIEDRFDHLIESMGEIALTQAYDVRKTAKEQGWVLSTVAGLYMNIHPKAFRYMTDADFITFSMPYPFCVKLCYPEAKCITDDGFCAVLPYCFLVNDISFSLCHNMTDRTLKVLGDNCPYLRKFSLLTCLQVSDAGIADLVSKCKILTDISLDWCDNLSDASLEAIGKSCPELRTFCATCSQTFTITGFRALLKGCPKLEKIELWKCTRVDDEWIEAIREHGAQVNEFYFKPSDNSIGDE